MYFIFILICWKDLFCQTMSQQIKFSTVNVAGMHDQIKRAAIFSHLLNGNHDIIALQETHCKPLEVPEWEKQWPGTSIWNPKTQTGAGVAVLFKPGLAIQIKDTEMDFNGRVIKLNVFSFIHSFTSFLKKNHQYLQS